MLPGYGRDLISDAEPGDEQLAGDPIWQHVRGLMAGKLSLQEYAIYNWRGAAGYGVYRTNIAFMDQAAEVYGPAQRAINRRLKKALDPLGILAPGKSGIV